MKIALISEFSSLHKYLKEGLVEIGEEVTLVSSGDGYKKIGGADYPMPVLSKPRNLRQRMKYGQSIQALTGIIKGYDVVQLIHTNIFSAFNNTWAIRQIKKNNGVLALVSAGMDYAYFRAYKSGMSPYNILNYVQVSRYSEHTLKGHMEIKSACAVERMSNVIIPAMYDYTMGYDTPKLYRIIPLPINTHTVKYEENTVKGKIVFFHGLNRESIKGTSLIRMALDKLQSTYPHDVDVIIDGHMPFDKYVELMKRVNVVIDQTYGYAYGVNACIALAQGKITVSPCKQVAIEAMGASYNPFVSILPDVDDIYQKLCGIIENRNKIAEMGHRGREFVETYHDHVVIAQKYLDAWRSVMR